MRVSALRIAVMLALAFAASVAATWAKSHLAPTAPHASPALIRGR